jgi:hypothetical protein
MAKRPKTQSPDYRLTVLPHRNERTSKPTTLVTLETAQSFAAFQYDLSVEEIRSGDAITYKVLGLKAPSLSLPTSGPARFVREYDDLSGIVSFTVIGLNGVKGACSLRIGPRGADVVRSQPGGTMTIRTTASGTERR